MGPPPPCDLARDLTYVAERFGLIEHSWKAALGLFVGLYLYKWGLPWPFRPRGGDPK